MIDVMQMPMPVRNLITMNLAVRNLITMQLDMDVLRMHTLMKREDAYVIKIMRI